VPEQLVPENGKGIAGKLHWIARQIHQCNQYVTKLIGLLWQLASLPHAVHISGGQRATLR
jgi:hypothetical protein